jgi:hypothetical protein
VHVLFTFLVTAINYNYTLLITFEKYPCYGFVAVQTYSRAARARHLARQKT